MDDPFNLQRFVDAQFPVYKSVLSELRQGKKRSHWMWFTFPQMEGLGSSPMAKMFAIKDAEEAKAYLNHPVLGPRLIECTKCVTSHFDLKVEEIFGFPDYLKFWSCMTLFNSVSEERSFKRALTIFYKGELDPKTAELLARPADMIE